jgi:hypothetical protein
MSTTAADRWPPHGYVWSVERYTSHAGQRLAHAAPQWVGGPTWAYAPPECPDGVRVHAQALPGEDVFICPLCGLLVRP